MEQIGKYLQKIASASSSEIDYGEWQAQQYNKQEGKLNAIDGIDCLECKNKGFIMDREGVIRPCSCSRERANKRRIMASGLRDLDLYTFQRFEITEPWQKSIRDAAVMYAKNPEGWFFLGGQCGAGKTHLCTAICRHLIREKKIIYFCWRDDAPRLKAKVNDEDYGAEIGRVKEAEVLYIDDLFKTGKGGEPTEADVNLAFEILNFRYNGRMPTIISTELTLPQIKHIDDALAGRIAERAGSLYAISIPKDAKKNHRWRGQE